MHFSIETETVHPSQKDDCHPFLADVGIDQFSTCNIDNGEDVFMKPLDSF